jgi:hypothetical protein
MFKRLGLGSASLGETALGLCVGVGLWRCLVAPAYRDASRAPAAPVGARTGRRCAAALDSAEELGRLGGAVSKTYLAEARDIA